MSLEKYPVLTRIPGLKSGKYKRDFECEELTEQWQVIFGDSLRLIKAVLERRDVDADNPSFVERHDLLNQLRVDGGYKDILVMTRPALKVSGDESTERLFMTIWCDDSNDSKEEE